MVNIPGDFMGRYTDEQTHKIMSSVHSKDTNIELTLRKALWKNGLRYRKNYNKLPGKPDIVFTKYKLAIFCDAEFWHGKNWCVLKEKLKNGKNSEFWVNKIERNINRDAETDKKLISMGWTVLRFWGNDILKNTDMCVKTVEETILDIQLDQNKYISSKNNLDIKYI